MSYFADLSPYTYEGSERQPGLLNVGWLDEAHEFATGQVPSEFVTALGRLCLHRAVARMRGYHQCRLPGDCTDQSQRQSVLIDGEEVLLGSAEIRAIGEGGVVYAAPNLVYHYVTTHGYQPPEAFITAVLKSEVEGRDDRP